MTYNAVVTTEVKAKVEKKIYMVQNIKKIHGAAKLDCIIITIVLAWRDKSRRSKKEAVCGAGKKDDVEYNGNA